MQGSSSWLNTADDAAQARTQRTVSFAQDVTYTGTGTNWDSSTNFAEAAMMHMSSGYV